MTRGNASGSAEFALIERIRRQAAGTGAGVALGIGDDAALLDVGRGRQLVAAVDTLVAGVHFPHDVRAEDLGWKALAVNLSDLAAMGAKPAWALLALTLPQPDAAFARALMRGFHALARHHAVALVGGDTTRGPLSLAVTALGEVPRGRALRRDAARIGDLVCVSGVTGEAAAGLAVHQGRLRATAPDARALLRRLHRPEPRVALGLALHELAHACIDVSDGLAADLGHVLHASGVGASIEVARLPASPALVRALPDAHARAALQLSGGDDYELCFTLAPARARRIAAIAAACGVALTVIGRIEARRGLRLRDGAGRRFALARRGYEHFVG